MFSILVNGQSQTYIPAADRGLHYGDGLFETIRVDAGIPRLWERHWRRLSQGCARLGIEGVNREILWNEAIGICADIERGVLKLIITRGEGGRGYRPARNDRVTRILATYPWPDYPAGHWQGGVTLRVCTTRLGRNTALAGLKHLNRLEQVLARREWDDPQIAEGLMLDDQDRVISGTMTNLFIVRDGRVMTPPLTQCGVEGIMRGLILELAGESAIPCEETILTIHHVQQADEIFLTNALIGLWPVSHLERQVYSIGPITRRLAERLGSLQDSAVVKED